MTPRLEDILQDLHIPEALDLFRPHWEASMACFPDGSPPFLCAETVRENRRLGGLDAGVEEYLLETARLIRETPSLLRLAWHCDRLLFEHLDYDGAQLRQWPDLHAVLPERSEAFYLLIALDTIPRTYARHRELGIPEEISHANCSNLNVHVERCILATGRPGTQQRLLFWLRNHTTGILYRLGRFQYMLKPFRGQLRAYRSGRDNRVIALANDGLRFSREGWLFRDMAPDAQGAWTSKFHEDDDSIHGNPISPWGHAEQKPVRLDKKEWRLVLGPGNTMIEMHIPAGGGMTPERCIESMRMATEFFPKYFPDQPFKGVGCTSWVFSPRYETLLPPDANMRLFDRELYLYPISSGRRDGLYFIFATDDIDPATAPRDTSIRRVMLTELEADRPLTSGGMFLLKEDIDQFGTQFYRRHYTPERLS